jgi:hypothetical protein
VSGSSATNSADASNTVSTTQRSARFTASIQGPRH